MKTFILLISSLLCAGVAYADDEAALHQAIAALNAKANDQVSSDMVATSVAQETGVPVKTVKQQMSSTHLSYGDLLVADSLSAASGKSLAEIQAAHAKGKGWTQIAKDLSISSKSLVNRARHAKQTVEFTQNTSQKRGDSNRMMMQDAGLNSPKHVGSMGMGQTGPGGP